ncbi:MAG: hypothetical protein AAF604_19665 [Acidobacteriota bacterium]
MGKVLTTFVALALVAGLLAFFPPGFGGWQGRVLLELPDPGHQRAIVLLAPSDDGGRLAALDAGGTLKVWQVDGALLGESPAEGLLSLAWTAAGDLLAGSEAGELLRWPAGDLAAVPLRVPVASPATALGSGPGNLVAYGTAKGAIAVLDDGGEALAEAAGHLPGEPAGAIRQLAWLAGGELLSVSAGGVLRRWAYPGLQPVGEITRAEAPLAVTGNRAGGWRWVDAGGAVHEESPGTVVTEVAAALGRPPRRAAFAGQGAILALGGDDGSLLLRDLDRGRRSLLGAPVVGLATSPDGRWLVLSQGPGLAGVGQVTWFDRQQGERRGGLFLSSGAATCLRFLEAGDLGIWLRSGERLRWQPSMVAPRALPPSAAVRCPPARNDRFQVRRLNQVGDPEVILEDLRSGWLVTLEVGFSRLAEATDRGLRDFLLGAFAWSGLRQDGTVMSFRHRPRWPLPAILLLVLIAVWIPGRWWVRRRRRLAMLPPNSSPDRSSRNDHP